MPPKPSAPIPGREPLLSSGVTVRELIGLVLAVALSNGFLISWMRPDALIIDPVRRDLAFIFWNVMLLFFFSYAYLKSWFTMALRWLRTGSSQPLPRRQSSVSALFVAEATVIAGTLIVWPLATLERITSNRSTNKDGSDAIIPITTLAIILTVFLKRRHDRRNQTPARSSAWPPIVTRPARLANVPDTTPKPEEPTP